METSNSSENTKSSIAIRTSVSQNDFYPPFAAWLRDDLEEVTHSIVVTGDAFKDNWGTPNVIGKFESRRSDVIKAPTTIISALIRTDTTDLVSYFGQACAYKLFSHKSYLVIPVQIPGEELIRMHSLCRIVGVGLVVFDNSNPTRPYFELIVRATKHEPDLSYTNRYLAHVEVELFS
jgi:hypothetical protein